MESPCTASAAKRAEGDGVAPRLGGEVPAESEHPVPAVQLTECSVGIDVSCQFSDRGLDARDVLATAPSGFEFLRRFGRVLCDVGGNGAIREGAVESFASHNAPHIELAPPGEESSLVLPREWLGEG